MMILPDVFYTNTALRMNHARVFHYIRACGPSWTVITYNDIHGNTAVSKPLIRGVLATLIDAGLLERHSIGSHRNSFFEYRIPPHIAEEMPHGDDT